MVMSPGGWLYTDGQGGPQTGDQGVEEGFQILTSKGSLSHGAPPVALAKSSEAAEPRVRREVHLMRTGRWQLFSREKRCKLSFCPPREGSFSLSPASAQSQPRALGVPCLRKARFHRLEMEGAGRYGDLSFLL